VLEFVDLVTGKKLLRDCPAWDALIETLIWRALVRGVLGQKICARRAVNGERLVGGQKNSIECEKNSPQSAVS
jgi:hypothetical protein